MLAAGLNPVFSHEYEVVREVLIGARHEAGLSQRALAALLGKTGSHVAMIERGQRRVDLLEFCRIAESLGVFAGPSRAADLNRARRVAGRRLERKGRRRVSVGARNRGTEPRIGGQVGGKDSLKGQEAPDVGVRAVAAARHTGQHLGERIDKGDIGAVWRTTKRIQAATPTLRRSIGRPAVSASQVVSRSRNRSFCDPSQAICDSLWTMAGFRKRASTWSM